MIAALAIPVDFSRSIAAGESGRAQVLVDGRRSNSGQITVAYLSTIAADVGAESCPTPSTNARGRAPLVQRIWSIAGSSLPGLTGILALFSSLLITLVVDRARAR